MGKQPLLTQTEFRWHQQRPGYYTAHVDGIAYSIENFTGKRWRLVGTVGPSRAEVVSTIGATARDLRAFARRGHSALLTTLYASAPTRGAALIGDAILTALSLPHASLTLTDEGNGWLAAYSMRPPGGQWVRIAGFKPAPADALRVLDLQIRGELSAGGSLRAELMERAG